MLRATASKVMWVGRATVFMVALAVSLVLLASQALAAINAGSSDVTVAEGSLASNSGTYSNPLTFASSTTITASAGNVSKTGTTSGTWSWSHTTSDGGPSTSGSVLITATHRSVFGGSATELVTFRVNVNNVAPTATFNAPSSVDEGRMISLSLTDLIDPAGANDAPFQYAFDCDDGTGYGVFSPSNTAPCPTSTPGTRTVKAKVRDKDGGTNEYTQTVTITDDTTAPTVLAERLVPTRLAVGVWRNTDVSATFSEEMTAVTLKNANNTSSTFKLQRYNRKLRTKWKTIPATITLSVVDGKTVATLDPYGATEPSDSEQPLAANKKFRGLITTGAKDLGNNPLAKSFVWIFRTGST